MASGIAEFGSSGCRVQGLTFTVGEDWHEHDRTGPLLVVRILVLGLLLVCERALADLVRGQHNATAITPQPTLRTSIA